MHKLESFALSTGTKIHKPHIEESFYPIVHKKFICISKNSVSNAKSYDFYDDVHRHGNRGGDLPNYNGICSYMATEKNST